MPVIQDIRQHTNHYALLALWLGLGLLMFVGVGHARALQLVVVIVSAAGYTAWGVIHHYLMKDLSTNIVLEYLLTAVLIVVLFVSVLLQ